MGSLMVQSMKNSTEEKQKAPENLRCFLLFVPVWVKSGSCLKTSSLRQRNYPDFISISLWQIFKGRVCVQKEKLPENKRFRGGWSW